MAINQHCTSVAYFLAGNVRSYAKCEWNRVSKDQDKLDHDRDVLIMKLCGYYSRQRLMLLKALIGLDYQEAEDIIMGNILSSKME